jgi:hypothetical protein
MASVSGGSLDDVTLARWTWGLTIEADPNKAVKAQPTPPPTPCNAKTSSDSSIRRTNLSRVAKLEAMAVMAPILTEVERERGQSTSYRRRHQHQPPTHATAEATPTYPAAGVIPTNPAIAPEQNPTAENLRSSLQSINIHTNPPTEADIWVTTRAMTALKLLDNPEPPLNPNQPSQRNAVPSTTKNVLCGL